MHICSQIRSNISVSNQISRMTRVHGKRVPTCINGCVRQECGLADYTAKDQQYTDFQKNLTPDQSALSSYTKQDNPTILMEDKRVIILLY